MFTGIDGRLYNLSHVFYATDTDHLNIATIQEVINASYGSNGKLRDKINHQDLCFATPVHLPAVVLLFFFQFSVQAKVAERTVLQPEEAPVADVTTRSFNFFNSDDHQLLEEEKHMPNLTHGVNWTSCSTYVLRSIYLDRSLCVSVVVIFVCNTRLYVYDIQIHIAGCTPSYDMPLIAQKVLQISHIP